MNRQELMKKLEAMFDDIAKNRTWANVEVECLYGGAMIALALLEVLFVLAFLALAPRTRRES